MVIPELSPWIGWPLITVSAMVFGLASAPEQSRTFVHRFPVLKPTYRPLDWAIELICGGLSGSGTMTAGEAINALMTARPNSIETTESRLRDKASMGTVRVWGKKIPAEFLPLYYPSLEEIPQSTWAYAQIDLRSISGPLPTNSLAYLNPHRNNTGPLFNAVRFNKQEIINLCRAESS